MLIYMDWRNKRDLRLRVTGLAKKGLIWGLGLVISSVGLAKLTGSLAPDAILERLQPMGQVNVLGVDAQTPQAASTAALTPKDIYENNCKMCHQTGIAGAPKFGNKADWDPRIAQGLETLVQAAITGIRAMPPKGNCLTCTNDEIKATVEYMIKAAQ